MINGAVNDARALDIRYIIILFFFVLVAHSNFSSIFMKYIWCRIKSIWQQFFFWIVNQCLIFILPDQERAGQHWKIHGAPEPDKTGRLNWEHDGKYKVVKSTTWVAVSNHGQIALRELHSYIYKELSSSIFRKSASLSVSPVQISLFSIYKGINALSSHINYHQLPHTVQYTA